MSAPPFFVVGFQRSGTTLLRLMLDSHPELAVPLDTVGLWARYEDRLAEYGHLAAAADRDRLVQDILAEERIRLWETPFTAADVLGRIEGARYSGVIDAFYRVYAERRGKSRWGDKDPGNMTRIDQLHRWFPDMQIVHIIRDGRDACLSQTRQDFGYDNVLDCACAWREEVEWVRRMGELLGPAQYHELRYEDLLEDPAGRLRQLCEFLGVPYREEMLAYHQNVGRSVPEEKRHLWPLLDRPPQKDNAGRWKQDMAAGTRVCFEKRAGRVLRQLGYETLPGSPSGAYLEELRQLAGSAFKALRVRLGG